jgi:hypothetical protein
MGISKTQAKPKTIVRTTSKRKPLTPSLVLKKRDGTFSVLVSKIAESYGVQVAAIPKPVKNPYAMTAAKAAKVARRAGIITNSGKLSPVFE